MIQAILGALGIIFGCVLILGIILGVPELLVEGCL